MDSFRKFRKILDDNEYEYHTYTTAKDKTHAFVIRGIDSDPDPKEIREQLEQDHIPEKELYRMKSTKRPLFMLVTAKNIKLSTLINNIHVL
ncbi:hypothetical protein JTB14_000570 [Gonioctena quinquepunctata]|nr:hypothetical protein JTB14_000570 [Gonioctena quinquepunctata]